MMRDMSTVLSVLKRHHYVHTQRAAQETIFDLSKALKKLPSINQLSQPLGSNWPGHYLSK